MKMTMRVARARAAAAPPAAVILLSALLATASSCSGGSSQGFQIDPANPLASSHAAVEALSDSAFVAYLRGGLEQAATGSAWGERLLRFLDERSRLVPLRQVESTHQNPPEGTFYLAVHPPDASGLMFYFRDEPRALLVPRIPMAQGFAGIIFGHELQHAYDAVMQPHLIEKGSANYTFMELNAYRLTIELADNLTDGAFQRELEGILEDRQYDRRSQYLLVPDRKGRARLDALFGAPSPWELGHRGPVFILGLTYLECANQVERIYATLIYHRLHGIPLVAPGGDWFARPQHAGLDLGAEPGESFESPLNGRIVALLSHQNPRAPGHGVIIEGTGDDDGRSVRLLNVQTTLEVGSAISRGEPVGLVDDVDSYLKGLRSHVHLEYYENGRRREAVAFAAETLPDRRRIDRVAEHYEYEGNKPLKRGFEAEEDREYEEAIEAFEEALSCPSWEVSLAIINHYIARCHAALGDFEAAAEAQRPLVRLLELELAYSRGEMPSTELGLLGAVGDREALEIWLDHQQRNLNAYEQGMDTLFVY